MLPLIKPKAASDPINTSINTKQMRYQGTFRLVA
jgi:hypothetical protein